MDYRDYVRMMNELAENLRKGKPVRKILPLEQGILLEVSKTPSNTTNAQNPTYYAGLVRVRLDNLLRIESDNARTTHEHIEHEQTTSHPGIAFLSVPLKYSLDQKLQLGLVYAKSYSSPAIASTPQRSIRGTRFI